MKIVNSLPWCIGWSVFDLAAATYDLYIGDIGNAMLCAMSCVVIIFCYKLTKDF